MKILGVIVEYNPFHNGHLYHLRQSIDKLNPDYVIAVMSGQFTQRGEAAIVDKWSRARMALANGVDLVLELPAVFATQTAELFAFGAIQTLNHTGVVTHLSFGSEMGQISPLITIANILSQEPIEFKKLLGNYLRKGLSFPHARHQALIDYLIESNTSIPMDKWNKVLNNPNSILGIEYLKALIRTKSVIKPITITRVGSHFHDQDIKNNISSATAIRKQLLSHGLHDDVLRALPKISAEILHENIIKGTAPISNDSLEQALLTIIRHSPIEIIENWFDVEEGLENRIKANAQKAGSLSEFLRMTKTKRYVYTRLQRILIHGLLGITKDNVTRFMALGGPQYLRILGFAEKSTALLKAMKDASSVPIITKAAHYTRYNNADLEDMFRIDTLATDLYSLGFRNPKCRIGLLDFVQNPVIL